MDGDCALFNFRVLMAMSISSCSRLHVQIIMNKFMYHLVRVGGWLIIMSDAVHVSMISPNRCTLLTNCLGGLNIINQERRLIKTFNFAVTCGLVIDCAMFNFCV